MPNPDVTPKEITCVVAVMMAIMLVADLLLHWIGPLDDICPKRWRETETEYVLVEFEHFGTIYTCVPKDD